MTKCKLIRCFIWALVLLYNLTAYAQSNSLIVSWNPNTEPDLLGYKVYYGLSSRNYDTVIDVANQTSFMVDGLTENVSYYFAVTAYDSALNESAYSAEAVGIIEPEDQEKPTIANCKIIDETHVDVTFSEPLSKAPAETAANYSISGNIQITNAVLDANQIVVHLTTSKHRRGFSYSITINNVQDLAATPNIIEANSSFAYFFPVLGDGKPPTITSARILSPTRVELVFNEMITRSSAVNKSNYRISDNIEIYDAALFEDCVTVHLSTNTHEYEKTYTVTVNNIYDREEPSNCISENYQVSYILHSDDTTPPEIVSAALAEPTRLNIQFSEPVTKASAENEDNYLISDNIQISSIQLGADSITVQLTTTAHQLDKDYTVTINNIYDCANHSNKIADNSRVSYRLDSVDKEKPEIVSVTIVNEEQVNILFSESINQSSTEKIENYSISDNIQVLYAALHSDTKTAILKTSPHKCGKSYTITINNIADRAPQPNIIEPNSSASYFLEKQDNEKPIVLEVKIQDETKVDVIFNEPIERTSAETIEHFRINKNIQVTASNLDANETIVHLTTTPHKRDETYTLVIEAIMDKAENGIEPASYTYYLVSVDTVKPEIEDLLILDNEHLDLKFSEQIDRETAEIKENYALSNGVQVVSAVLDGNLKVVHLTTTVHQTGVQYALKINNIKDRATPANEIEANSIHYYELKDVDNTAPVIIRADILSETKLNLIFSEPMAKESAEDIANYDIRDGITVKNAILDDNLHVVHLTTSAHSRGNTYTIIVNNLADLANPANYIERNSTYSYYFEVVDKTPPHIQKIDVISLTQLYIYFDEPLDELSARNKANYSIDKGIIILDAQLSSDYMIVQLTTNEHRMDETYTLTVNHLEDNAPTPNEVQNLAYSYYQKFVDHTAPEVVSVELQDATHLLISFNEAVEQSGAEKILNYRLDNGIFILNAKLGDSQKTVKLTTSKHRRGQTYMLILDGISDLAETPNYIQANSSYVYYFDEKDSRRPSVISVLINNETELDVTFDEQLDHETAEDEHNYIIDGGIQVLKAELDHNLRVVHLSTSMHERGRTYYTYISNIKDRAEEANAILPNTMASYYLEPIDMTRPKIDSVLIFSAIKVDISFSEPVDLHTAENTKNYQVNNGISVLQARLDNNLRTVHLTTAVHTRGQTYKVFVSNILDRAPMPNPIIAGSWQEYEFEAIDVTSPKLIGAELISKKQVILSFSEKIERNSAQNIENYSISNYIEVTEAELDSSECNVILYTTRHQGDRRYTVTVNNTRDLALVANVIERNSSFSYWVDSESILKNINMALYEPDSLSLGDRYYIDRSYTVTELPKSKEGLLWIKTANSDRDRSDAEFLSFDIEENMKVYVGYDSRTSQVPDWLKNNFKKTEEDISVSDRAQKLVLWEKVFPAGKVKLGGNSAKGAPSSKSMYVVLVEAPPDGETFAIEEVVIPETYKLHQNFPNPFNAETKIKFDISVKTRISLKVYNILGQEIKVLFDDIAEKGQQMITWNATDKNDMQISSGIYFIQMLVYPYEGYSDNHKVNTIYREVKKLTYVR